MSLMENWIQSHGAKIHAVFAQNDEMGMGALLALERAGLKDRVVVTSIDAIADALLAYGIRHFNSGALRMFARHWWSDASAKALAQGHRNYTMPLEPHGTIQHMDDSGLLPGDLAVTSSGVHILAYLGDGQWIQADPGIGAVAILHGHSDSNRWFEVPVSTYRWPVLTHR